MDNKGIRWSKEMADSLMKRTPILSDTNIHRGKWSYDYGVILKGIEAVWKQTGDVKYFNYIKHNMDVFINEAGTIKGYDLEEFNIDFINNGKVLLMLYKETGQIRYKNAVDVLRKQLNYHPRTSEGVFWHKKVYPHQIWLDGLYMGAPFYAEYIKMFGNELEFEDVTRQYLVCVKHTKDQDTGLLYHAFDELRVQPWCHPVTGQSKSFWGRSLGWFVMGLVDTLSVIPSNHKDYNELLKVLKDTLHGLKEVQDHSSGVWYQVLNQGKRKGNYLESSSSCMIVYAIAKGIRLKYLETEWIDMAQKAYSGIIEEFILFTESGLINLNKTCQVAGLGGTQNRDGTFAYYISEPIITNDQKGIGAFILASTEMERLLN